MKKFVYFLILFQIFSCQDDTDEDNSIPIYMNSDEIQQARQKYPNLLIYYYNYNRNSDRYVNIIKESQRKLQKLNIYVGKQIVIYENGQNVELSNQYPKFVFYLQHDNQEVLYQGQPNAEMLINFSKKLVLKQQQIQNSKYQRHFGDCENLLGKSEISTIFFGSLADDNKYFQAFKYVTSKLSSHVFAHTDNKNARNKYQIDGDNAIVIYNFFEGQNYTYEGNWEPNHLHKWIKINAGRNLIELTFTMVHRMKLERENLMILAYDPTNKNKKTIEKFQYLKINTADKIVLALLPHLDEKPFKAISALFDIKEENLPALFILQWDSINNKNKHPHKFRYQGPLKSENMLQFFEDWQQQKLKRYYRSEPLPPESHYMLNDSPIKQLVAKNFKKLVNDPNINSIVYFYSNTCQHCNATKAIVEKLAQKLYQIPGLVFYQIESELNEIQSYPFENIPSLAVYSKQDKHPKLISFSANLSKIIALLIEAIPELEEQPLYQKFDL